MRTLIKTKECPVSVAECTRKCEHSTIHISLQTFQKFPVYVQVKARPFSLTTGSVPLREMMLKSRHGSPLNLSPVFQDVLCSIQSAVFLLIERQVDDIMLSLLDDFGCRVLLVPNHQTAFRIYLNEAKANIFLKHLLWLIPDKRCDWNGCQFLSIQNVFLRTAIKE